MAAKRTGSDEEVRVVGERYITELLYTLGGQGSPLRGNGVGALQVSGRIRATICTDRRPEALFPVLCALCSVLCSLFSVRVPGPLMVAVRAGSATVSPRCPRSGAGFVRVMARESESVHPDKKILLSS